MKILSVFQPSSRADLLPAAHQRVGGGQPDEALAPQQVPHTLLPSLLLLRGRLLQRLQPHLLLLGGDLVLLRLLGVVHEVGLHEVGLQYELGQPGGVEGSSGGVDERGDPETFLVSSHREVSLHTLQLNLRK